MQKKLLIYVGGNPLKGRALRLLVSLDTTPNNKRDMFSAKRTVYKPVIYRVYLVLLSCLVARDINWNTGSCSHIGDFGELRS